VPGRGLRLRLRVAIPLGLALLATAACASSRGEGAAAPVPAATPAATPAAAPVSAQAPEPPPPPAPAPVDAPPDVAASHADAIRELIATTGSLDRELARVDPLVAQLRANSPELPEAVWTNLEARLRNREALLALYVPVYARHLPETDVRSLIEFYRSPLGRRSLEAQERIRETSREAAGRLAVEAFGELAGSPAAAAPSAATSPPPAPTHAQAIRELIEASRVIPAAQETMRRLLDTARANPLTRDTPPEAWTRAERRLTDPDTLRAIWVPAYAAHLPEPEVRALTAFYRSPLGARVAEALPRVQAELGAVAQNYGATAARRAIRDVMGPLPQWRPPPSP
jgi:hypothetical protein